MQPVKKELERGGTSAAATGEEIGKMGFGDHVYVDSVFLFRCQWLHKHGSGEYSLFQSVPP